MEGELPDAVTVRVSPVGDGVTVEYPPGVTPPTWLNVTAVSQTATTAEFSISATDRHTVGTRSVTVRFVAGKADGSNVRTFDMPVTYTITASDLAVSTGTAQVDFVAARQGAVPAMQTVTATFTGTLVRVSGVPPWLTLTPLDSAGVSPVTFGLTVNSTNFAVGTALSSGLVFVTSRSGSTLTRSTTVRVNYTVVEPFDATAPAMAFNSIRGSTQPPQPVAGFMLSVRGGLARWRISAPSWVRLAQTSGTGPANINVTANAAEQGYGVINSQVTVTDDDSGQMRSLPVSLDNRAARLTATPTSVQFTIDNLKPTSSLSQILEISDELGGAQPSESVAWTLQSVSAPWLRVTPVSGGTAPATEATVSLDSNALTTLPLGQHTATITLNWQNAQFSNQTSTITVQFDFRLAHVRFVAPYIGVANQAGTLIARGQNFTAAGGAVTAALGTTELAGLVPDSADQLTINYPAMSAGRYPVSIKNLVGITRTDAELVVLAAPTFNYQAIAAPSPRRRIAWDAERQTLYGVNLTDQQVERYHYSGGSWTTESAFILPELRDISLTPNGRSLILLSRGSVYDIQLASNPWVAQARATNPDVFCGRFLDRLAMSNNGRAFVVTNMSSCSGYTGSYLYNIRDYSLAANPYFQGYLYNGIVSASADGSRMYAGSNGLSPAPEVKIFNSLTDTVTAGPINYNLFAATVSGDASRVILQNRDVYSRALTLTGNLGTGVGVALASRDSSRAFVYRDDGGQARIVVYDLNGALLPGAVYPVSQTIILADSPNASTGTYSAISMATTHDDSVLFVSGNRRILVVPVVTNGTSQICAQVTSPDPCGY